MPPAPGAAPPLLPAAVPAAQRTTRPVLACSSAQAGPRADLSCRLSLNIPSSRRCSRDSQEERNPSPSCTAEAGRRALHAAARRKLVG